CGRSKRMAGRNNLVAIAPEADLEPEHGNEAAQAEPATTESLAFADPHRGYQEDWMEEASPAERFTWAPPALAGAAVLGWTAFFAWVNQRTMLAGASPAQWSQWIVDWSIPVLLVIGLWLLAMRNSRREAARF